MTATESRSVTLERLMPHPPEKVWRALTQGPLLEDWLMANDFEPVVGRDFSFRMAPMEHWDGVVLGRVLTVEPHRRLTYSWGGTGGSLATVVTWTLTPTDGGTLLQFEQSGFVPQDDNNYKGATWGWQRNLGELERVLGGMA